MTADGRAIRIGPGPLVQAGRDVVWGRDRAQIEGCVWGGRRWISASPNWLLGSLLSDFCIEGGIRPTRQRRWMSSFDLPGQTVQKRDRLRMRDTAFLVQCRCLAPDRTWEGGQSGARSLVWPAGSARGRGNIPSAYSQATVCGPAGTQQTAQAVDWMPGTNGRQGQTGCVPCTAGLRCCCAATWFSAAGRE